MRMDRHNATNNDFSQFCEGAWILTGSALVLVNNCIKNWISEPQITQHHKINLAISMSLLERYSQSIFMLFFHNNSLHQTQLHNIKHLLQCVWFLLKYFYDLVYHFERREFQYRLNCSIWSIHFICTNLILCCSRLFWHYLDTMTYIF
jgi:hypothetical protein